MRADATRARGRKVVLVKVLFEADSQKAAIKPMYKNR